MQAPLALRHGKLVVGLGEVIHADENVTGIGQAPDGQLYDLQLGFSTRQVAFVDATLRFGEVRQVGVVVN